MKSINNLLKKDIKMRNIIPYLTIGILSLYICFPIVNLLRQILAKSGLFLDSKYRFLYGTYFQVWTNYIFVASMVALVILLLYTIEKRENCKILFKKLNILPVFFFSLLAIWIVISTIVNGWDYESVFGNVKSKTGLLCTLCYLFFFVLAILFKDENQKKKWIKSFIIIGTLISFIVIISYYFLTESFNVSYMDLVFYNRNHISYYLLVVNAACSVCFMLLNEIQKKKYTMLAVVVSEWALIVTDTLGCTLAYVVFVPFMFIVLALTKRVGRKNSKFYLTISLIVFIIAHILPNSSGTGIAANLWANLKTLYESSKAIGNISQASDNLGTGRMILWRKAIECIKESPIFGFGLSSMRAQLLSVSWNNTVHNELLEYASYYGIPALVIYLCGVMSVFLRGLKYRLEMTNINIIGACVAFAYLVSSFFGVTMFYTTPYLFIFLGLAYYKDSKEN